MVYLALRQAVDAVAGHLMDDSSPIIDVTAHPSIFVPADDFWSFLRRRKGAIALFWFLGLLAAFWWILNRPRIYEAESRIMIVRTGSGGPVSEAELASEIELVRDPSHLDKAAARQLVGASDLQIHELQRRIDAALAVGPAGKSNLVAIQYRDSDPTAAARIVNQIVDYYLADRRAIFQTGVRSPGDPNSPAAELLSAFDAVNHGTLLRSELESRVQRSIELESRVTEFKAQVRDHQEAVKTLRKRLTSLPDRIQSSTRTRSSVSPANRQVEETEILNPLKQQIDAEILKNETSIAGLHARAEETILALRDARIAENRTSALTSERDKLERRAVDARAGLDPNSASERANLRATLINRAEPPYGPMPRRNWIWIPLGIFLALLLAMLIAWVIDQVDKPIYTPDDFEDASGVPPMDDFAHGAGA